MPLLPDLGLRVPSTPYLTVYLPQVSSHSSQAEGPSFAQTGAMYCGALLQNCLCITGNWPCAGWHIAGVELGEGLCSTEMR